MWKLWSFGRPVGSGPFSAARITPPSPVPAAQGTPFIPTARPPGGLEPSAAPQPAARLLRPWTPLTLGGIEAGLPPAVVRDLPVRARQLLDAFAQETFSSPLRALPMKPGQVAVVVAAYNESSSIGPTLSCLLQGAVNPASTQVIVSVNGLDRNPNDQTAAAVMRWASEHPGEVELWREEPETGQRTLVSKGEPGALQVTLLERGAPGKVGALCAAEAVLARQTTCPEFVFTLDADTHLAPGDLDKLVATAQRGYGAVSARVDLVPQPGQRLDPHFQVIHHVHGKEGLVWTPGAHTLSRTDRFFPAMQAIRKLMPDLRAEDAALGMLVCLGGDRVVVDREVSVASSAALPQQEGDQKRRWVTGQRQLETLLGKELLAELGLDGRIRTLVLAELQEALSSGKPKEALALLDKLPALARYVLLRNSTPGTLGAEKEAYAWDTLRPEDPSG